MFIDWNNLHIHICCIYICVARLYIFKPIFFWGGGLVMENFVICIFWPLGIFYGHLVYFSVLVCCINKNLATLPYILSDEIESTVTSLFSLLVKLLFHFLTPPWGTLFTLDIFGWAANPLKKFAYILVIRVTRWVCEKIAQNVAKTCFRRN
jgi:hypothetical protein